MPLCRILKVTCFNLMLAFFALMIKQSLILIKCNCMYLLCFVPCLVDQSVSYAEVGISEVY
uniref:Uncharacterized protein n=2 Tax=Anguilla anguilla TaxID=7936 RepID=A0A0E9R7C8_ANGAN